MDITTTTENIKFLITIVHVSGDIDSTTSQDFNSKMEELISNGARHILVDLSDVPFISSAGLRVIHHIFNQLRALHKDADDDILRKSMSAGMYKSPYLKVTNPIAQIKEVFELGGFDTYIEIHNDVNNAITSF